MDFCAISSCSAPIGLRPRCGLRACWVFYATGDIACWPGCTCSRSRFSCLARDEATTWQAASPMLMAMGATLAERWLASLPRWWRWTVETAYFTLLVAWGMYICTAILPLASSGPLKNFALENNGELREESGWNDLVKTVAGIRDSLPPEQQEHVGVLAGNYGEQGAIEILGPAYHLPAPISMTN